jgi:cell filamentation protein
MGHSMKDEADPWRSYFYDDAPNVLRNKHGIKSKSELDKIERLESEKRANQLKLVPLPGNYDFKHLLRFHEKLFHDTYEWAGQPRTVDMMKGNSNFTPVSNIELVGERIGVSIQQERYYCGLDKALFVEAFTDLHASLDKLHPFREGNGRATKAFLRQLAHNAGYDLDFSKITKEGFITAAAKSFTFDFTGLRYVFQTAAAPLRAIAFRDSPSEQYAVRRYPELFGAYKALYAAKTAGMDMDTERQRVTEELLAGRLPGSDLVTQEESRLTIQAAAAYQGLLVTEVPLQDTAIRSGKVVAATPHHVLIQTQTGEASCYQRNALAKQVFQGEYVEIRPYRKNIEKHPVVPKGHPEEIQRAVRKKGVTIPENVPPGVFYQGLLRQYVTDKHRQGQRIEELLEKQAIKHAITLFDAQAERPKFYALIARWRRWKTINISRANLATTQERLKKVREYLKENPDKINAFAEAKMRRQNKELSRSYDKAKESERVRQLNKLEQQRIQTRRVGMETHRKGRSQ